MYTNSMRSLLVRLLVTAAALFVTSYFVAGFIVEPTWQAYLLASLVYILVSSIAGPLIKLLLLPLNLLTLGLLRWLTGVIILYLFDLFSTSVTISGYTFPGLTSSFLSLPSVQLSLFWTLVLSSFVLSLAYSLLNTLVHGE